eukprot:m.118449 g.118449  ORF g.118449 m.118449 type:complete len:52 (-) comp17207_c0_seq1:968-1123(-)
MAEEVQACVIHMYTFDSGLFPNYPVWYSTLQPPFSRHRDKFTRIAIFTTQG